MIAEKKSEYYREEFSGTWAFDITRVATGAATETVETLTLTAVIEIAYASTPTVFGYGVRAAIQAQSSPDGSDDWTKLILDIPDLGLDAHEIVLDAASVITGGALLIEVRAKKRYSRSNQVHRVKVDDIRVDVDGVNQYASGAQSFDSGVFTATGVPLFGGMPKFYTGVESDIVPAIGADAPEITDSADAFEVSVRAEAHLTNCTWRRKTLSGDSWVTFPISIRDDGIAYGAGDCDTEEISSPTGTTTTAVDVVDGLLIASSADQIDTGVECPCPEGTIGIPSVNDKYSSALAYKTWGNNIRFIPDCDKLITRMVAADHAELVKRGGTPRVESASNWEYARDDDILISHTTVVRETEVHPEQSAETATITGTAGDLEGMLGWTSYCDSGYGAMSYTAERTYFVETSPASCSPVLVGGDDAPNPCFDETVDSKCYISKSFAFPSYVQPRTGTGSNPDIWPELDHLNDEARKINTVDAPLWNFLDYFPEDSESDEQSEWPVQEEPVTTKYFISLGHQWDGARMTLISAPLGMGAHGSYIADEYLGRNVLSNWVGSEIIRKDTMLPDSSKQLASANSGQFSIDGGTLTFGGSDITVNPDPGETEVTVTVDAAVWTADPRMYAQLADRVRFGFEGLGISSAAVYAVGIDGSEYELYNEAYAGAVDEEVPYGIGTATKYAGTWAQQLNAGIIASDQGSDSLPSGISAATMGDPERLAGFQLLTGRGVKEIKFVFAISDDTDNITLEYPIFYASENDAYCVAENRGQFAIVWEDGPKIRPVGNVAYYDSGAVQTTPVLFDLGLLDFGNWTASLIDFLCARRNFYSGVSSSSGLTTELASLFDSEEGQTVAYADDGTIAWMLEYTGRTAPLGFWVNSCGCPPVPCDVTPGYASDWDKDAALRQEVVTYAVRPRRIIADRELHLFEGSSQWTALERSIGDDWRQTAHYHAVGNNELGTATIRSAGITIADSVSPWHGFAAVVGTGEIEETARGITHACTGAPDWRHAFAWMDSADNVVTGRSPNTWPYQIDSETQGFTADWVHLTYGQDASNTLTLIYESAGSIYRRTSTDEGRTWSVATTVFTGPGYSKGDQFTSKEDGNRFCYAVVPASNLIKGKIYDAGGNVLESEFTAIASGVADDQIRAWERIIEDGRRRVALGYINTSGSYVIAESDDGKNFA